MTTTTSTSSSHHQHHHHAVVCFGDSLTAGTSGNFREYPYAPHLEKALQDEEHQYIKNVTVSHFGLPGWTTQNMLDKLNGGLKFAIQEATSDDDDGRRPPSLVIILAGTNDLGRFVSSSSGAKTVTENIIALHRACYEMHVPRTLAIAIPPSAFQHYNSQASTLAHAINENLQGYCREQEQQRASFFPFPFNYTRGGENWNVDGLHFSPHGYQMLGESLAPIVASILQELDQETTTTTSNR